MESGEPYPPPSATTHTGEHPYLPAEEDYELDEQMEYGDASNSLRDRTPDSPVYDHVWAQDLPDRIELRILLHSTEVGAVIGKGGSHIREATSKTGARMNVENSEAAAGQGGGGTAPQPGDRLLRVGGRLDRVAKAVGVTAEVLLEHHRSRNRHRMPRRSTMYEEGLVTIFFLVHRDLNLGDEGRRVELEELSYARLALVDLPGKTDDQGVWAMGEVDALHRLAFALGDLEAKELTYPPQEPYVPYDPRGHDSRPPCPLFAGPYAHLAPWYDGGGGGEASEKKGPRSAPFLAQATSTSSTASSTNSSSTSPSGSTPASTSSPHMVSTPSSSGDGVIAQPVEVVRIHRKVEFDSDWQEEVDAWLRERRAQTSSSDVAVIIRNDVVHLSGPEETVMEWVQSLEDVLDDLRGGEEGEL
ncbi:MAG: hypothetical protein DHS80DRAFT_23767 [Piptocephalis tieghemiana]|nr:MAG: hypothetical protein DHS80DRAFT_23767 [Piptocephalis tieghemiana]